MMNNQNINMNPNQINQKQEMINMTPNMNLAQMNLVPQMQNMNIQNNLKMNQNFIFHQLVTCIDNLDIYNLKTLLSEHQFSLQTKNILLNKTLLIYLTHYSQINLLPLKQIISLLLQYKANPNLRIRFNNQNTFSNNNYALFSIVDKNDIELVKIFLDNGAEINICDCNGRNCLFYLMKVVNTNNNLIDRRPLCSLLLGRGIKMNLNDNNGFTPLMEAIIKNYIYIMDMFIKFGADVNIINFKNGNTAMHYAVMNKNREAIWILLGKGKCDLTIKNKNNESVIDLVKRMNNSSNNDIYDMIMNYVNIGKEKEESEDNKNLNNNNNNINNNNNNNKASDENEQMFIFPKDDITSRVEIPFTFQNNGNLNQNLNDNESASTNGTNISNNSNQFHSFIKFQNTPTLFLDISDETNQEKLICDSLETENQNLNINIEKKQNQLTNLNNDNEQLKNELLKLKNEFIKQSNEINMLNEKIKSEEIKHIQKIKEEQNKVDMNDKEIKNMIYKFENLKKNPENNNNNNEKDNLNIEEKTQNERVQYLLNKFSFEQFSNEEIYKNLTEDLNDFYRYNKLMSDNNLITINKIISHIKELIEFDCDVKLYGSYATGSSLLWSDIDIVIIPNKEIFTNFSKNNDSFYMTFIQNLYVKLKNPIFTKEISLIDDTYIIQPIIKLETNEDYNELTFNIYILDNSNSHYENENNENSLIQSIKMLTDYNDKFPGIFLPILVATKQLLYNSVLIYNYHNSSNYVISNTGGISSYALNILIIDFLEKYYKNEKEISSLGKVFFDFLKTDGLLSFENSSRKIVILDYNHSNNNNEEILNYYKEGMNDLIIIDPFNIRNNLSEKTFRYSSIKLALMIGYCVARDNCECGCHYCGNNIHNDNGHCILNKIFKTVKRLTNSMN